MVEELFQWTHSWSTALHSPVNMGHPPCLAGSKQQYQSIGVGCIVRDSIIQPDRGLPHRGEQFWHCQRQLSLLSLCLVLLVAGVCLEWQKWLQDWQQDKLQC